MATMPFPPLPQHSNDVVTVLTTMANMQQNSQACYLQSLEKHTTAFTSTIQAFAPKAQPAAAAAPTAPTATAPAEPAATAEEERRSGRGQLHHDTFIAPRLQ